MKFCFTLLCSLVLPFLLYADTDDTTRVLFIGNSFTYTADVPGLVKDFANTAKLPFKFVMHAPPGASVGDTDQGPYAHMFNPDVYELIRSDKWNFVCLQDNQGRFVYGKGIFPNPKAYKVIEGHITIKDSVLYHHPCAHMLWFAGWAFKNGYPGISPTGKGLIDNIYENYQVLKDTAGEIISPIGIAWTRSLAALPATDLWSPDEAHQSLAGSYLTAAVIFTSIFRINTEAVMFNSTLDSTTARTMRRIAYETVMDSMATTGLGTHTASLLLSGSTLTATAGYKHYEWYRNNLLTGSGPSNVFTVSTGGCYQVIAMDNDSCRSRSREICTWPASIPGHDANGIQCNIYPIPSRDVINITLAAALPGEKTVMLRDGAGKLVNTISFPGTTASMPLTGIAAGIYFITITSEHNIYHHKIVKID